MLTLVDVGNGETFGRLVRLARNDRTFSHLKINMTLSLSDEWASNTGGCDRPTGRLTPDRPVGNLHAWGGQP